PPGTAPSLPGDVVLGYVPPHPAHSTPRQERRYLVTLLEQRGGKVENVLKATKSEGDAAAEGLEGLKAVHAEREKEMMFKERSTFLPLWRFMNDHNMTLRGYGFFTSCWNPHTPEIYRRLGIHEPVYSKVPTEDTGRYVAQIENAARIVRMKIAEPSSKSESESSESSKEDVAVVAPDTATLITKLSESAALPSPVPLTRSGVSRQPIRKGIKDLLNAGERIYNVSSPDIKVPSATVNVANSTPSSSTDTPTQPARTRMEALVAQMKQDDLAAEKEAIKKRAEKEKRPVATVAAEVARAREAWREVSSKMMPRLTDVAAAALVRTRKGEDVAAEVVGPVAERVRERRGRYANV
ncbi:hypothetical protein HK102_002775, partial [Quaeritorhiza haematococci]